MIKRILIVIILILAFALPAHAAWYLACDIPVDNATGSNIKVDGGPATPGLFQVSADGQNLLLLDMTPYLDGAIHIFEAQFTSDDTLPSPWSAPFSPGVLNSPVLRLIQQ